MKSNRVLLIGYIGNELQSAVAKNGSKRVGLRIATHYPGKSQSGEREFKTVWHDVVSWDSVADYAFSSLVKGSRVMVDGYINYTSFLDHKGHVRYMTQVIAHSVMNLDR